MAKEKLERWIDVFARESDKLIDRYSLESIQLELMKDLFNINDAEDPEMIIDYKITSKHVDVLEKRLGVSLDLDRYEYFVTCAVVR